MPNKQTIALALGSNIGDRFAALRAAVAGLVPLMDVAQLSPVYETAPAYVTDQPPFLNMALIGTSNLPPLPLLQALKKLETVLGRTTSIRYGPRILDIDIVFFGGEILDLPQLNLPHPRLAEREFVLRPLADIVPGWVHPQTGLTIARMLEKIRTESAVCLGPL